jgi:hypothetical protein
LSPWLSFITDLFRFSTLSSINITYLAQTTSIRLSGFESLYPLVVFAASRQDVILEFFIQFCALLSRYAHKYPAIKHFQMLKIRLLTSPGISLGTTLRIFTFNVNWILLYGCETWWVTQEIWRKLWSFVNWCLCRIVKVRWPVIITNDELW